MNRTNLWVHSSQTLVTAHSSAQQPTYTQPLVLLYM
jgi:hypothetical protein